MEALFEFEGTIPLTLLGLPVLAVAGLGCLLYGKGKSRRCLDWTAGVFLGTAVLWLGGNFLLSCWSLRWRLLPSGVMFAVLLLSGWVGIALTLVCLLPMRMPEQPTVLRRAAKGAVLFFAALVLLVSLWLGPVIGLFAFSNEERVVEYQGQTLLEVDDGFLDPHFSYYVYHGPLVRGAERVYDEYEPLH